MAASVDSTVVRTSVDRVICEVQLSSINPGATETITLPSNTPALYPVMARLSVVTPATSKDPVFMYQGTNWTPGGSNTGRTLTVILDTIPGGNLAAAVVKLYFEWLEQGSGGISA